MSQVHTDAATNSARGKDNSLVPRAGRTPIPLTGTFVRRFFAFAGPGYLVATGYMDPGNWATALAGGSQFGTHLLFIAVLSSLMAILLQALSARLAFATGQDLAQLCRQAFPRPAAFVTWIVMETAIIATDLAEVIGTAIGLELLFGIPLGLGVLLTGFDSLLILGFEKFGFRKIEAFVVSLLILIAACFAIELLLARPDWSQVAQGLMPSRAILANPEMLYIAIGIIGATIMPHNLYLHSGLLQTRVIGKTRADKAQAIRFSILDSGIALSFALIINGAILVLAAAAFHANGEKTVVDLADAYRLIAPLLGTVLAAKLFAVALIACGLNSTLTATLAGQIIMEGFVQLKLKPVTRRLVTRGAAIIPAMFAVWLGGDGATGRMLVFSQVILSLTLPFAVVPLVFFTASKRWMGEFSASRITSGIAAIIAIILILLNGKLVYDAIYG